MSKLRWDQSFSSKDYIYGVTENEFVNQMSDIIPERSKIACFAEGEGRNAVFLAKLGHHVTAYDQSTVGLEKANQLAKDNDVMIATVAIDLTKETLENEKYDAAIMVFGHVPKKQQQFFLNNMIDSVKKGGHLIVEVYSEDQFEYKTGGPPTVNNLYNPVDILNWLKQNECKFLHFYYGEAERHEGKRHTGLCHVIQFVIEK